MSYAPGSYTIERQDQAQRTGLWKPVESDQECQNPLWHRHAAKLAALELSSKAEPGIAYRVVDATGRVLMTCVAPVEKNMRENARPERVARTKKRQGTHRATQSQADLDTQVQYV